MFLAHAPISYLANESVQKKRISKLDSSQQIFIAVLSLIFGILPDFDFLLLMMFDRPSYTHHDFFTHTPLYWVSIWLLLLLLSKVIYPHINKKTKEFLTKDLMDIILNAFLIAGISHFLADLLVGNIMLFYPISDRHFTLLRYLFEPSYFTGYFGSVYFAIEILFIAIFFLLFSSKFLKKHKWDDSVAYVLIVGSLIYLAFTVFFNIQTYNNSFLEDSNKPYMDYDMDYDGLRDVEDMDVDNDGVDNILSADRDEVAINTGNIMDSNALATGVNNNLVDSIQIKYGSLTSYRLVSQAFYESLSPIEPVLKDFYVKSLDKKRYTVDFDHVDVLYDYLESKDMLIDFDLEHGQILQQGKLFFLLDEKKAITNMGISLGRNEVGIVLPTDTFIQRHTFDEIQRFYGDTISTFQIVP